MKTDDLIKGLSADAGIKPMPMRRAWLSGLAAAILLAAIVFFPMLGPRPDVAAAVGTMRFDLKLVLTLTLSVTSAIALARMALPGASISRVWLLVAPALLLVAFVAEWLILPADLRMTRMMGTNNMRCLIAIPAIGALPLVALLLALRHGAPTDPTRAGAVAGLLAGGVAATFYALHCFDDSPLFVAVWYTMAIGILALIGAIASRLILRW